MFATEYIYHSIKHEKTVGIIRENDEDDYVQLILDKEVVEGEYFVFNTGINTTHLKIKTEDLVKKFLPHIHHRAKIVDL